MELTIGAVALAPVIVALIQIAKMFGLPARYAPLANAILSVIAYLVVTVYLASRPEAMQAATVAINALVIFLTAAGVYTTTVFTVDRIRR